LIIAHYSDVPFFFIGFGTVLADKYLFSDLADIMGNPILFIGLLVT
jgi:hypothetical protein